MPDENAKQRMARHIAGAWLAGALAGVVVTGNAVTDLAAAGR